MAMDGYAQSVSGMNRRDSYHCGKAGMAVTLFSRVNASRGTSNRRNFRDPALQAHNPRLSLHVQEAQARRGFHMEQRSDGANAALELRPVFLDRPHDRFSIAPLTGLEIDQPPSPAHPVQEIASGRIPPPLRGGPR